MKRYKDIELLENQVKTLFKAYAAVSKTNDDLIKRIKELELEIAVKDEMIKQFKDKRVLAS